MDPARKALANGVSNVISIAEKARHLIMLASLETQ